ncbi:MAG: hypothetical protein IJC17_05755 [Clostridia bacterium]|nr:hypothetical protein [Clostridia bacterium]
MLSRLKSQLLREPQPDTTVEDALAEVYEQMDLVRGRFDWESDQDLIEACIYEMEALNARRRYLLGIARRDNIRAVRPLYRYDGEGIG